MTRAFLECSWLSFDAAASCRLSSLLRRQSSSPFFSSESHDALHRARSLQRCPANFSPSLSSSSRFHSRAGRTHHRESISSQILARRVSSGSLSHLPSRALAVLRLKRREDRLRGFRRSQCNVRLKRHSNSSPTSYAPLQHPAYLFSQFPSPSIASPGLRQSTRYQSTCSSVPFPQRIVRASRLGRSRRPIASIRS